MDEGKVKDALDPGSGHPIPATVARLGAELAAVAGVPAWSLDVEETRAALVQLYRVKARTGTHPLRT